MTLTPEQIKELKSQLSAQVQHLPESQKAAAQQQINSLSPEALETMLKQQPRSASESQKGIFRMIIDSEIPSKKIDENNHAIAVLDIKPISKGHTIIIPKNIVKAKEPLPKPIFSFAKKISKKIESKLKAKSAEIIQELKFGETIVNIIPVYDSPLSLNSPRLEASEKDLEDLYNKLKTIKKVKLPRIRKTTTPQSSVLKLDRKIP